MTKDDFVFFWGHTGDTRKSCFSQWFIRDFTIDGISYCCMEQYMMAEKAKLFGDTEILEKILKSSEPQKIKSFGRAVRNFDPTTWDLHKCQIVYQGNLAKFGQNEDLKTILLATNDKILVEASPYDKIWGVGMSVNDIDIVDPNKWKGHNLLGETLMKVRETLKFN
ncbi:MAG: NADAR family protein [Muribaculum sp.]|nr:NADAR family protein [Muribaculum sp.]